MVFAALCLEAWLESSNFTKLHLNGWLITNNKHAVGGGSTINAKCMVDQQWGWLPVGPPLCLPQPPQKKTMPYFRIMTWSLVNFGGPSWACVGPLNKNNDSILVLTYRFCSLWRNVDSKLCPIIKIFIHKIANKNSKKTSQLTTFLNDHRIIHNHIWNNATKENLHSLFTENHIWIKLSYNKQD
jgi:hypothetical protein